MEPKKQALAEGLRLPMPFKGRRGGAKLSRKEIDDYRRRQKLHHERHPDYVEGWSRPAKDVAQVVWERLAPRFKITVENLLPALPLKPEECSEAELTVKQAF